MIKKRMSLDGCDVGDLLFLDPNLFALLGSLMIFCESQSPVLPLRITSLVRPYDNISTSDTHQTARAFDIGTSGMSPNQIAKITAFLNDYDSIHKIGAITRGGLRRIVYEKPHGTGPHLHVQSRRDL